MGLATIAAVIFALAGLGVGLWFRGQQDDPPADAGFKDTDTGAQAALCAEVFVAGQPIDPVKALAGCKDMAGKVRVATNVRCSDGSHLWQVDSELGAPEGFGKDGQVFTAVASGKAADDAGYKTAHAACAN